MNRTKLLLFLMVLPLWAQGQETRSWIGLSATRTTTDAMQWADLVGGPASSASHGYRIGLQYQRIVRPKFALEGGLYLTQAQYQLVSLPFPGVQETVATVEPRTYRLVSLLVRPKYYVNTHQVRFYVVGGASVDVQNYALVNEDNNSGVGAQLGAGLEGSLGSRLIVSVESSIRTLSLIRFVKEQYPWRVVTAGVQLGFHYGL